MSHTQFVYLEEFHLKVKAYETKPVFFMKAYEQDYDEFIKRPSEKDLKHPDIDLSLQVNLKRVTINDTYYRNCNIINNLKLTHLNLNSNRIGDIRLLREQKQLQVLYLNKNRISSLEDLSQLTSLQILECTDNKIQDLTPLDTLFSLEQLDVSNNILKDSNQLQIFLLLKRLRVLKCENNDLEIDARFRFY